MNEINHAILAMLVAYAAAATGLGALYVNLFVMFPSVAN